MALTTCSVDTDNITNLDDLPNDVGGLTASQLKALFDKFGADFVAWFNATHITEVQSKLLETLLTTQGDIPYASAANTPARLAKGTAGQQLRMNIGATAPEWFTVPASRAYHNANQSISDSGYTVLAFNSERFDTDNIHDNATNNTRLTCKTAGKYLIVANASFESNATGSRALKIMLNGTGDIGIVHQMSITGGLGPANLSLSTIYDLAINDYVELYAYQSSGGSLNVLTTGNYSPEFMMVKVG
jgi:hypothetical protein